MGEIERERERKAERKRKSEQAAVTNSSLCI